MALHHTFDTMQPVLMFLLASVVLTVSSVLATSCDTKGAIIEKSFFQSVHDCVEYLQIPKERMLQYLSSDFPPDDETKCLIYCVGVDLRWWNNTCGLQMPPIVSYFQPVHGDTGYEKRTKECLDRRVGTITSPNNCCQAYETFQCYFQEFGNLVTCPQYVPLTKLQATQVALDCLVVLRYPEELLKVYASGKVEDSPETRCLYLCIDQRSGLYTHEDGILPHRFFVRDAAYNDLRYLCKETKECRDRIRNSGCDPCTEAYTTHVECLTGLGESGYTSGIITHAAQIALTNLGIPCVHPEQPCPICEPHHTSVYPAEPHYPEISYEQPHYPSPKHSCSSCGKKYFHRPSCSCAERPKPHPTHETVCSRCHKTPVYNKPHKTGYSHYYKPEYL